MGSAKHGQYARRLTARRAPAVDHRGRRSFCNKPDIGNPAAVLSAGCSPFPLVSLFSSPADPTTFCSACTQCRAANQQHRKQSSATLKTIDMEELPTSSTGPPIKSNATKKREARVAVIREEPHSSSYPLLRTSSVDSPSIVLPRPRTRSASTSTSMRSSVRGAAPRKKPGPLDGDGRKRKISPQQNFQDKTNAVTVTASGMRAGRPPLARQVSTSSTCKR